MNNLPDVIKSSTWKFADDIKLFHCKQSLTNWTSLQTELDSFMNWCITWQLLVNTY